MRKTLSECWLEFLVDIEARKLHESTIRKYRLLQRQMQEFAASKGLRFIDEFDLSTLSAFRSRWKDGPRSSAKKLERMRAFLWFVQRRNWILNNPAIELKAPKVTLSPTLPFSNEEMYRILAATNQYRNEMPSHGVQNGRRIRGLVLLLRYGGMRIGDAVNLNIERLKDNRVFLYTQKTGVPVNTVLPDFCRVRARFDAKSHREILLLEWQREAGEHRAELADTLTQTVQAGKYTGRTRPPIP